MEKFLITLLIFLIYISKISEKMEKKNYLLFIVETSVKIVEVMIVRIVVAINGLQIYLMLMIQGGQQRNSRKNLPKIQNIKIHSLLTITSRSI